MLFFILLSIILFFFCLYFYLNNKKLNQRIIELELETKKILERKIVSNKDDLISIENISIESNQEYPKEKKLNSTNKEKNNIVTLTKNIIEKKYTARNNKEDEYQTPIIPNPNSSTLVNPTANNNSLYKDSIDEYTANVDITSNFNPIEFIPKENKATISVLKNNKDNEYLKKIAMQLENELTPKTVELTDYEKKQEEQAVISYQELLSLKEKIKNDEKKDTNFIEDLKELRKLLD
jgi:hypothetical protein